MAIPGSLVENNQARLVRKLSDLIEKIVPKLARSKTALTRLNSAVNAPSQGQTVLTR